MRFPHFRWVPINGAYGQSHARAVTKILWHTTQGPSIEAAESVYRSRGKVHPHITYDPRTRRGHQHVDTSLASYALWDVDRYGVIQVELVGYSEDSHNWPDHWLQNIAKDILVPVALAHPLIDIYNYPTYYGEDAGFIVASQYAPQRMSKYEFAAFVGQVGHQHAPRRNDHWDPGKLNVHRIADHAILHLLPPPVEEPPLEDLFNMELPFILRLRKNGARPNDDGVWPAGSFVGPAVLCTGAKVVPLVDSFDDYRREETAEVAVGYKHWNLFMQAYGEPTVDPADYPGQLS